MPCRNPGTRHHRLLDVLRFGALLAGLACLPALADTPGPRPVPVIYDTDIWGDIDDAFALAMLHALQDRGEVRLLAVTIGTRDPWCAVYVDVIDHFYGHASVPIGLTRSGIEPARLRADIAPLFPQIAAATNYTQHVAELRGPDGSLRYARRLAADSPIPEAIRLLRQTLAGQPDGSVVLIQVGYSSNFAQLLDSAPDGASPLSGEDLVRRKVRLLSAMAGSFAPAEFLGMRLPAGMPEANVKADVGAARRLFEAWPTPIVFSGFEIGMAIPYPAASIERDFAYATQHPLVDTYLYTDPFYRTPATPPGRLHDHATFDLTSVLYAARPDSGYFSLSPRGTVTALPDGGTRFEASARGKHRYLILDDQQRARAGEAMTQLASQPPLTPPGAGR